MRLTIIASLVLAFVAIIGGMSPAMAETAPTRNPAVSPLDTAAEGCRLAIEGETAVAAVSEEYVPLSTNAIPACVAHEAMQAAYWAHQTTLLEITLAGELAGATQIRDELVQQAKE